MSFKLYDILGVSRGASKDEIKRAYKKMAIQHHPDKGGDPEKFKDISNAYTILSDDQKRAHYDQVGDDGFNEMHAGGQGDFGAVDPREIFEKFFGGAGFGGAGFGGFDMFHEMRPQNTQVRRNDHIHHIRVSLSDAYHGCTKTIRIGVQKMCMSCKETCGACQGKGSITDMRRMGFFTQIMTHPCDACRGAGSIFKGQPNCKECEGKGTFHFEERKEIHIPKAVMNGHVVKLTGLGEQQRSETDIPGDLVLQIVLADDTNFARNGSDLVIKIPISFADSVMGKKITIPHFAGDLEVDTQTFGIVRPDKPYALEGKGMPTDATGRAFGKLYIHFQVEYPDCHLSSEQVEKVRECFQQVGITKCG